METGYGTLTRNADGTVTVDGYTFRRDAIDGIIEVYGVQHGYTPRMLTDDLDWLVARQDTAVFAAARRVLLAA